MGNTHRPKLDETLPTRTNPKTLKKSLFHIVLIAFHLVVLWQVADFPFLGDSIPSNLFAADNIYLNNFSTLWNIPEADPGHGTLYPIAIALVWTVFGQSLFITHLVQVALGFWLCLLVYKIARRNWGENTSQFAALLFSISPLYVAQLTNASLQLPLTLAVFAAYHAWQKRYYTVYTVWLCLMMLVHLQAAFLLLFLCLNDVAIFYTENGYKKLPAWLFKRWWIYSLPFLVFITWGLLHYLQFGWAYTSPNYLREAPTFKWLLYNLAIGLWRIVDFGYFVPAAAVLVFFFMQRKKLYLGDKRVQLLAVYFLMLLVLGGGISVVFAHPPIHRYFLPTTVLLFILLGAILEGLKPANRRIWAVLAAIGLVSGNFMYYPGKCIGDANIAYAYIFELEKKVTADFPAGTVFYTYAPLSYPSSIRYLDSTKGPVLKGLYHTPIDSVAYVLRSNMNCEFSPEELDKLEAWYGNSYEKGGVYITVYANPLYFTQKPKGWRVRQPSATELWIQRIKGNFK